MRTKEPQAAEYLRAVLGSVIDRNGGRWLRFILAILKNEADAEDVIQEAVRRVLTRNQPLSSQEQVKMYLGRAIGNAALESYNSRKRERMRQTSFKDYHSMPSDARNPYACIEERERSAERERLLRLLHEGLAHLPTKQHEALRLTILESRGLSIRDVGLTSGIPYSTLRHRSREGLRRLRRFLKRSMRERIQNSGVRIQNSS